MIIIHGFLLSSWYELWWDDQKLETSFLFVNARFNTFKIVNCAKSSISFAIESILVLNRSLYHATCKDALLKYSGNSAKMVLWCQFWCQLATYFLGWDFMQKKATRQWTEVWFEWSWSFAPQWSKHFIERGVKVFHARAHNVTNSGRTSHKAIYFSLM